jgi:predicted nucleic acid-binding protein
LTRVSSFDATLDADVLIPITLCDTLLRLAEEGFYRPHWSQETLDEIARNLVSKLAVSQEAAAKRVDRMRAAFPEALVVGYKRLIPTMPNDPKDRHVLAAAVRSGSQVIVTSNVRHFPAELLREFDVEAQRPDLFLIHQCALDAKATAQVLRRQAADKRKPPRRTAEVLDRLAIHAPNFAKAMRLVLGLPVEGEVVLPPGEPFAALATELEDARARRQKAS